MPHLEPFRGLRYDPRLFPDLKAVVAPPYDVIGPDQRQVLLQRHERNVVRLVLGLEAAGDSASPERYATAARTLAEWVAEGVLVRDLRPALYGFAQRFADPLAPPGTWRERTGFIGRARLEPWGRGIHPHERTLAGPKADRLRLLEATHARLDCIFGLVSDSGGDLLASARRARDQNQEAGLVLSWTDEDGIENALWAISDPTAIEILVSGVASRDIVIADGHHRYETALAFHGECERRGSPLARSAGYVLMYLSSMEDPALCIQPVHRILSGVSVEHLSRRLAARFRLEPVPGGPQALAARIANGDGGIGFVKPGEAARLVPVAGAETTHPAAVGEHPAAVVDREILGGLLGWEADEAVRSGRLRFSTAWQEARAAIEGGKASCAFLLPPTPVEVVAAAARQGLSLPQKSTYFYPKIPSGLVFDLIED